MPRVMCVWFPKWPIQRLRVERPDLKRFEIALFSLQRQRPTIVVCTAKAERLGLHPGQPLAEAKALLPRAVFLPADAAADRAGLCQIALEVQCFTPLAGLEESDAPESLLCDVSGCAHLWDGEEGFLQAVRKHWQSRGYRTQIALAGSVGAAWALAHSTPFSLVPEGQEQEALRSLHVSALRLPTSPAQSLLELGLVTIGDVLGLPRETLTSRFGPILPRRLDQALGLVPESFICERLKEPLSSALELEVPIEDRLTLDHVCKRLLSELVSRVKNLGMGILELEGKIQTESGPVQVDVRLVEPSCDLAHLTQLTELQLERKRWSGGVVAVHWSALRLGRLEQTQADWFDDNPGSESSREFRMLVERLTSRLEPKGVLRVEMVADSQPEYAVRLVPWAIKLASGREGYLIPPEQSRGRPIRLLGEPLLIEVNSVVPDGPPVRIFWRGRECHVTNSWGPERIETGWWRAHDVERDYYRVEWDDGTHAWVYRDFRLGGWYLHGFFD